MASRQTRDHEEIRRWVEERGGRPAAVRARGDDTGILRIDFPDDPEGPDRNLEPIGWDEFFSKFDEKDLVFVYQEPSRFNKFVSEASAPQRGGGGRPGGESSRRRRPGGSSSRGRGSSRRTPGRRDRK